MIFNGTDWTIVASVAAGVAVKMLADWKRLKKDDPKMIKELPHGVVTVADDLAHWIGGLAKSPWFASEAATGKIEIHHITDKLLKSHMATAATDAIASFGKDFGAMTEGEKGTAIEMVQTALKAFGQDVTAPQSISALNAADARKAALQPTAKAATERSQALTHKDAPADTGQAAQSPAS